ncbi:MAG: HIT domain-containing protein [Acidimicrobiaceae bacterium]|nr:HIT domain-containing protein [Acidimicrobiaceae bacterium]
MFSHEPEGYHCPFCRVLGGVDSALNTQQDIVCRTERAAALISPRWWPNNHGHVLVVPTAHHENLYDLPDAYGHAVHDVVRQIGIAMRNTYGCEGISTRQHNEPAGNQDTWHYHVHVFPRYAGDDLYGSRPYKQFLPAEQRWPYADKLRGYLREADSGSRM